MADLVRVEPVALLPTQAGCAVFLGDGSKVIVSPHGIAKEIWVAAKSGGFHFRYDSVAGAWIDTRSGDALRARLVEILKQQGQVALDLS